MKDTLRKQRAEKVLPRTAVRLAKNIRRSKIEYEKGEQYWQKEYNHLHQCCLYCLIECINMITCTHRAHGLLPLHERAMLH